MHAAAATSFVKVEFEVGAAVLRSQAFLCAPDQAGRSPDSLSGSFQPRLKTN